MVMAAPMSIPVSSSSEIGWGWFLWFFFCCCCSSVVFSQVLGGIEFAFYFVLLETLS